MPEEPVRSGEEEESSRTADKTRLPLSPETGCDRCPSRISRPCGQNRGDDHARPISPAPSETNAYQDTTDRGNAERAFPHLGEGPLNTCYALWG